MTELNESLRGFEVVAETFFERYKRPVSEVAGERLIDLNVTEYEKDVALSFTDKMIGYLAVRDELVLDYNIETLQISLSTPEEQVGQFLEGQSTIGSQDIKVEAYDADGNMAHYRYDRATGLILVNNFEFKPEEVRPIAADELSDLRFSLNQINTNATHGRVLTIDGIARLTKDIAVGLQPVQPIRPSTPESVDRGFLKAAGIDPRSFL